jgi:hypothetical protein
MHIALVLTFNAVCAVSDMQHGGRQRSFKNNRSCAYISARSDGDDGLIWPKHVAAILIHRFTGFFGLFHRPVF